MSIFATAFRSSHGIGPGTCVVLIRWIRRVAFLGTAARARPCGHAFFVFRFLARGSAGTDVSFTGRAGRGLALSRRNKRRTKERRNDKSRHCKFGSHQKILHVTGWPHFWQEIETRSGQHCANFIFVCPRRSTGRRHRSAIHILAARLCADVSSLYLEAISAMSCEAKRFLKTDDLAAHAKVKC